MNSISIVKQFVTILIYKTVWELFFTSQKKYLEIFFLNFSKKKKKKVLFLFLLFAAQLSNQVCSVWGQTALHWTPQILLFLVKCDGSALRANILNIYLWHGLFPMFFLPKGMYIKYWSISVTCYLLRMH